MKNGLRKESTNVIQHLKSTRINSVDALQIAEGELQQNVWNAMCICALVVKAMLTAFIVGITTRKWGELDYQFLLAFDSVIVVDIVKIMYSPGKF